MTVHHISREDDQKSTCPYCGKDPEPNDWKSVFDTNNAHYKECLCNCGRRVTIKVPFMGSGHDSWNKTLKNLDKRIEEADSKSRKE